MKKGTLYCEIPSFDPYFNLAFEEYVFLNNMADRIFLLWRNDNAVIIGRNQNAVEEINPVYIREHGIHVVRRTTGGGAVYHDLGNLNYSFIRDYKKSKKENIRDFAIPLINVINGYGVKAEFSGKNDILVDHKKISGTAERIQNGRILSHGCILFNSNLPVMSQVLKTHPEKLKSKGVSSIRSRVGNLSDYIGGSETLIDFKNRILDEIISSFRAGKLILKEDELKKVKKLEQQKYRSWSWNYGESKISEIKNTKQFPGGLLEVSLYTDKGRIKECSFTGDFMAARPVAEIADRLRETPYDPCHVRKAVSVPNLNEYFGSITADELISCICCVDV